MQARALRRGIRAGWLRLWTSPAARSEAGWVVTNKVIEFGILFALLKVLTNSLGTEGFGEYNLVETSLILLTALLLAPMRESYLREYHYAKTNDQIRSAGIALLVWYSVVTVGVFAVAAVLSRSLAAALDFHPWTPLAAGLVFLFDRWRLLGLEVLNIQRRRRLWALSNLGYAVTLTLCVSAAMYLGRRTPTVALLAFAGATATFAFLIAGRMVREILSQPRGAPSRLGRVAWTFGVPFGLLLALQWVQGFTDRYLIKAFLEPEIVGVYVAVYQICGVPYTLVLRILYNLLTPIAYQRGEHEGGLWSADRLLIGGTALQIATGLVSLLLLAVAGRPLIVLFTNKDFLLPGTTIVLLAGSRFVQSIGQSLQPVFAVHHRTGHMLTLRMLGAGATVAMCLPLVQRYGAFGAALGSLLSQVLYLFVLILAPGGILWLARDARRRSSAAPAPSAR